MPVISIFGGIFCNEEPVIRELFKITGYKLVENGDIISETSRISGISESKIERAFVAKTSVFNKFTHERERSLAHLRLVVAKMLSNEDLIIKGFASQLIPKEMNHVLRVCLIADMRFRVSTAVKKHGMAENEAIKLIRKKDEDYSAWVHTLFGMNDPWDPLLYDILVPTDKMGTREIINLIEENIKKEVLNVTTHSKKSIEDFLLTSQVDVVLAKEGHNVGVQSKEGRVTLTINKHVLMLHRLEAALKNIANDVPGVKSVEIKVGPDFHRADIYRKYEFNMPSKVLLVDDEREFVQTLSERLLIRDMGSAVAYDGESALEIIREDEPEVMILDLRMPGIDGIEVLRRVKQTNPDIEVIILTGHGSEADRETCISLGAFAYLQKPVDIDGLSETIKEANEKIRLKKTTNH